MGGQPFAVALRDDGESRASRSTDQARL